MIGALRIVVDYDHVEEVTPARFHVPSGSDDVLKLLLLCGEYFKLIEGNLKRD